MRRGIGRVHQAQDCPHDPGRVVDRRTPRCRVDSFCVDPTRIVFSVCFAHGSVAHVYVAAIDTRQDDKVSVSESTTGVARSHPNKNQDTQNHPLNLGWPWKEGSIH